MNVAQVCSRNVVTVRPFEEITAAVRRMPVVGPVGELMGVLSLDEVLEMVSNELMNLAGVIRNERRIEASMHS